MTQENNLGKWIKEKFGSQTQFSAKFGINPTQTSRWINGAGISDDYKAKLRKLGYTGPWPREEAQEAAAPAGGHYVTERDFGKLEGRLEALERRLETAFEQLRDLYLRGPKESRQGEPPR